MIAKEVIIQLTPFETKLDQLVVLCQEIPKLRLEIVEVKQEIAGVKQEIVGLDQKIDRVDQKIDGVKLEVAGVKLQIVGFEQKLEAVRQDLNEVIVTNHNNLIQKLNSTDSILVDIERQMNAGFNESHNNISNVHKRIDDIEKRRSA